MRGSLFQNQREFYLQEQLRAIHRELGDDDGDDVRGAGGAARGRAQLPEAVLTRARREVRKLRAHGAADVPEATVGRNYLDWVLALPWTRAHATTRSTWRTRAQVLDEDHYGLEDVKDRMLDYIAVLGRSGKLDGPILCLVGPPGVGKTSLARSIARATGPQVRAHVAGRRAR